MTEKKPPPTAELVPNAAIPRPASVPQLCSSRPPPFAAQPLVISAPASAAPTTAFPGLTPTAQPPTMRFSPPASEAGLKQPSERPPPPAAPAPPTMAATQVFPLSRAAAPVSPFASAIAVPTQGASAVSAPAQAQSAAPPTAVSGLTARSAVAAPPFSSTPAIQMQAASAVSVPAQAQAAPQATASAAGPPAVFALTATMQPPTTRFSPPVLATANGQPLEWPSPATVPAPPSQAATLPGMQTFPSTKTAAAPPPYSSATVPQMQAATLACTPAEAQTMAGPLAGMEPSGRVATEPSTRKVRKRKEPPTKSKRDKEKRGGEAKSRGKVLRTGRPVPPEVQRTIAGFVDEVLEIGVSGFRKEFAEIKRNPPKDFTAYAFAANPERNRYKDVLCIDATRTVLTLGVPPQTDYIHANWVRMENSDKTFIAAQAPLDHTISDFWRLCFQENVTTVIVLCNVIEGGKRKSTQYWPLTVGQNMCFGCMQVVTKAVSKEDRVMVYTVEVLPDGYSNSVIVRIYHLSEWPDRGVPEYGFCVLRLLRKIDKQVPCLVHCSAGIGRTGTAIAIDTIIQRLFKNIPTNVKSIVQELRQKRASSVQTEAQYLFIVTTVLSYIKVKMPTKFDDKIHSFREDVKKANMV